MKDILFMMEQNCAKSMKQLLCIYPIIFIVVLGAIILFADNQLLFDSILMAGLLLMMRIHYLRIKNLVKDGALTRLQLLPVKSYAFVVSELLFCLASYMLLFVCFYFAWFVYAYMILGVANSNELIIATWSTTSVSFLFMDNIWNIALMFLYVLLFAFQTLAFSLSMALKENTISIFAMIYVSYEFIFTMETVDEVMFSFLIILIVGVIVYDFYHMRKFMNLDRKKVSS